MSEFNGFDKPNFTQIPNQLLDDFLPELSGPQLKVALYILRRTRGWGKTRDQVSIQQLHRGIVARDGRVIDHGTGLSVSAIKDALHTLESKKLIVKQRITSDRYGCEASLYSINIIGNSAATPGRGGGQAPGRGDNPPLAAAAAPQSEEDLQKKDPTKQNKRESETPPLEQNDPIDRSQIQIADNPLLAGELDQHGHLRIATLKLTEAGRTIATQAQLDPDAEYKQFLNYWVNKQQHATFADQSCADKAWDSFIQRGIDHRRQGPSKSAADLTTTNETNRPPGMTNGQWLGLKAKAAAAGLVVTEYLARTQGDTK